MAFVDCSFSFLILLLLLSSFSESFHRPLKTSQQPEVEEEIIINKRRSVAQMGSRFVTRMDEKTTKARKRFVPNPIHDFSGLIITNIPSLVWPKVMDDIKIKGNTIENWRREREKEKK